MAVPNAELNGDNPVHEPTASVSALQMAEYIKTIENRFEELEKKYVDLLGKSSSKPKEEEKAEENYDTPDMKKDEDGSKDGKSGKKDGKQGETKGDDNVADVKCTPELNLLSWVQWRKLKVSEEAWEKKADAQKKKELEKGTAKIEKFAIDVVSDVDNPGPYFSTDGLEISKRHWVPCRIRINSDHIIDALNEITELFFPQPCQFLRPFKVIVDHVDKIRAYMQTLEADLAKAKAAEKDKVRPKEEIKEDHEKGTSRENRENKQKSTKAEMSDVERADEKCKHYRCLLALLDTHLAPEFDIAKSIKEGKAQKVEFVHLWHLFPPGETIYYQDPNRNEPSQASQVLKVSGGRSRLPNAPKLGWWSWPYVREFQSKYSAFTIDSFYLDFDGKSFRLVQIKYDIPRYTGELPITSLKAFPLRFLPESIKATEMAMLLKRGQNFVSLTAVNAAHREYCGMTLDTEKEEIDGRVVVDFEFCPDVPSPPNSGNPFLETRDKEKEKKVRVFGLVPVARTDESEVTEEISPDEPETSLYNDDTYDCDKMDKLFTTNRVLIKPSLELKAEDLTEDELLLLPGSVYAYVLRNRRYCKCDITKIREVELNKTAFEDLVLPKTHQTLIKSLVDRHSYGSAPVEQKPEESPNFESASPQPSGNGNSHQDNLSIVKGKGRGLIILLHGVPGVGKTSTAETIAEATGRPLLPVTCGDIGENAAEVEKNLEKIFTNSHRWGCVLLLDEAEVFLAKRNNEDLKRNAMVSVFLRVLEYYSGILFLTTNRVGTIDEAFKSRVHISLYYPPLNWNTSKQIWRVNLRRSQGKVVADEEAIIKFAKKHFHSNDEFSRWNGRQIYNAFKTAIALAQFEKPSNDKAACKPELKPDHFKQVARASKRFEEYLLETQGGETIAAMNAQQRIRADRFDAEDTPHPLKRRPTRNRKLDMDDLPTTSAEDDSDSEYGSPSSEEKSSSEEKNKKTKKNSKASSNKKRSDKKSKKYKEVRKGESDSTSED